MEKETTQAKKVYYIPKIYSVFLKMKYGIFHAISSRRYRSSFLSSNSTRYRYFGYFFLDVRNVNVQKMRAFKSTEEVQK